ncbi:MAG TPA: hypothetical protein VIU12_25365 [Chryseolinea sp.]
MDSLQQTPTSFINYLDSIDRQKAKVIASTPLSKVDSVGHQLELFKGKLIFKIDSLKALGQPTSFLQKRLDSLEYSFKALTKNYDSAQVRLRKLETNLAAKVPSTDTLQAIQNKIADQRKSIDEVTKEVGIGQLGSDINLPKAPSSLLDKSVLDKSPLPATTLPATTIPSLPQLNTGKLDLDVPKLPDVDGKIKSAVDRPELKEAGAVTSEVKQYSKEIDRLRADSLANSKRLTELAEQQAAHLDEVQALKQQQALSTAEAEKYQKLIEQYKNEKKLEEALKEKSKDVVNDLMTQNQAKIDASLSKLRRQMRKFPSGADMRNLPKRAPNPMKGLGWRERLIPGFTMQTLSGTQLWLELDPQISYRLNRSWSMGVGGVYRFFIVPSKMDAGDFDNLFGAKVFAQYHAFKGFFLRAEGQQLTWKPWDTYQKDPTYREQVSVGMIGIGKSHMIAKKLRANVQTLYHISSQASDPYKPQIVIRFGLEFSLSKKVKQPWQQRLDDLKDCE